ncbi:hypothetical protein [Parenemella sanctibonifatiensis]|uniref:Aromatic ring-opening dioxygenase LigA n=1 Tax=Parenemella sanctibonifatiensis TaxID=2016505 RepID=A0A255E4R8_9ACTN|nr:hypothetical protein [Parenemella sanctibonifatiensis]OYN86587.1 aromatic ring-opening dioxygenase LigA [Parenemella sanctibonifatiensis]
MTAVKPIKITGIASLVLAIVFVLAGAVTWGMVTSQLRAENITVPGDSSLLPGARVQGPVSAYAQAQIINEHALKATGGKTYAELGKLATEAEKAGDADAAAEYQKQRATIMNASFLRASLFTSVVAYGVALLVVGLGFFMGLVGWSQLSIAKAVEARTEPAVE